MEKDYTIIENLYSDVKEWLKFAESKNAALLTFNTAVFFGIVRYTGALLQGLPISCILLLLTLSIGVNLYSFLPRKLKDIQGNEYEHGCMNLLYYSELAKLNSNSIRTLLAKRYYNQTIDDPYFKDLTTQIHSLSKLTERKNSLFILGLIITSISLILLAVNLIYLL